MAAKKNKTDPRNRATPVDQLRGSAKQARIARVTRAEAGPATMTGPSVGQTKRTPQRQARALPQRGGSSAGSPKAVTQRLGTAVRERARQDTMRTRALADTLVRNAERENRKIPADSSPKVRYAGPDGPNPKPKALPGGKQSALPAGQRGGELAKSGSNRTALPPGQRGGAAATSSRGAVANREAPRPRPGGRVVVDESPRLPAGRRGGDLARTGRSETSSRQPRLPADSRSSGTRIGNSSQPWGERAGRTQSPRITSSRALPPGRPGGPMVSGGAVPRGVTGALRAGAQGIKTGGIAGALIGSAAGAVLSPLAQRAGNALGKEIRQRLTPQRTGTESGRTGRGGTTADLNPRPVTRRTPAARPAPERQRPAEAQLEAPRPSGGPPRGGGMGSSSGRGSSTGNRSASGTGSSTTPTSPTSQSPTSQAPASNGNPGRGTSRTNNPLITKDSWMMDKLRAREQASADAAISAGKASPARYGVQASPAEYNVSEEEGRRRLKIKDDKDKKKK